LRTVSEILVGLFRNWYQKQNLQYGKNEIHNNIIFKVTHGSMSFWYSFIFLTKNEQLFDSVSDLAGAFSAADLLTYFLSVESVASIYRSSQSTAERDHCLSGN